MWKKVHYKLLKWYGYIFPLVCNMFKPVRILSAHTESTLKLQQKLYLFSYHLTKKQTTLIRNRLNETIQVGLIKSQTKNLPFPDKACFTDHHCFYCKLIRWTLQKTHALLARQESLWMFEYDVVFCILQLRKMGVATFEIKITQIGMIPFNIKNCYGQCSLWNLSDLIFNQSIQRVETRMTTGQT